MLKPTVSGGDEPAGDEQITDVANFAAQGWNYRNLSAAQRAALPSGEKFNGLVVGDNDGSRGVRMFDGTTYLKLGAFLAQHMFTYDRVSANATDDFASGSFIALCAGSWTSAPAGEYEISASVVLKGSAASGGNLRIMAGGTNVSLDMAGGVETTEHPVAMVPRRLSWAGGTMALSAEYQLTTGTGTVYKAGSYITVRFVSPA